MNVDLPEPDGPMRKTNSPLSTETVTLSRAGLVDVLYDFETFVVLITGRQCSPYPPVTGLGVWVASAVTETRLRRAQQEQPISAAGESERPVRMSTPATSIRCSSTFRRVPTPLRCSASHR